MNGLWRLVAGVLLALLTMGATDTDKGLRDGDVVVTQTNGVIFFEARNATIERVLSEAGHACGVAFESNKLPERSITARFVGVTLDELLARLDLSFGLAMNARGDAGFLHVTASETPPPAPSVMAAHLLAPRPADLPGPETWSEDIAAMIAALHDDQVRFNGMNALWDLAAMGTSAVAALEYTLYDDDYQARQFAAAALCWSDSTNYVASDRLLQVLVEAMADDEFPCDNLDTNYLYSSIYNARMAFTFFENHPEIVDRAEPYLVHALFSDDAQQRFMAAFELGAAGETAYAARLAQILVPHLSDNLLSSDAGLAAHALYQLGDAAAPYLESAMVTGDVQASALAEYILARMENPDAPAGEEAAYALTFLDINSRPPASFWDWMPENFPDHNGP